MTAVVNQNLNLDHPAVDEPDATREAFGSFASISQMQIEEKQALSCDKRKRNDDDDALASPKKQKSSSDEKAIRQSELIEILLLDKEGSDRNINKLVESRDHKEVNNGTILKHTEQMWKRILDEQKRKLKLIKKEMEAVRQALAERRKTYAKAMESIKSLKDIKAFQGTDNIEKLKSQFLDSSKKETKEILKASANVVQLVLIDSRADSVRKIIPFNTGRWTKEEHEAFLMGLDQFGNKWKKMQTLIPTRTLPSIKSHARKYGNGSQNTGRWTKEEHEAFLKGLEQSGKKPKDGKKWKEFQTFIPTRTLHQIKSHAQKYFRKCENEANFGAQADIFVDKMKRIIQHAKDGTLDKRTKNGEITVENGEIRHIPARTSYYFGELKNGELPEVAHMERIGIKIMSFKSQTRANSTYFRKDWKQWKELTKGIFADTMLPKMYETTKV